MIRFICYDITDDKVRTRLADELEFIGFHRIQYSVFCGRIERDRWPRIHKSLEKFHKKHCIATDRIFSHLIERDHFEKMTILGQHFDKAWILDEIDLLFI